MVRSSSRKLPDEIRQLREKHGFSGGNATDWSRGLLARGQGETFELPPQYTPESPAPQDGRWHPKNEPLLNLLQGKFAWCGFQWRPVDVWRPKKHPDGTPAPPTLAHSVVYDHFPTIGGQYVTLTDLYLLPVELFDGFKDEDVRVQQALVGLPATQEFMDGLERMTATGLGYKGLTGVSWLPGLEAMVLGDDVERQVVQLGQAIFGLTDAVAACWADSSDLRALLQHRVPGRIPQITKRWPVRIIRPDIVLVNDGKSFRPVCTELESCPAGQGMTHAMQLGYHLSTDMVDRFVELLDGRPFTVVFTHQWAEYLWDQGVFVAALRERGVDARIIFDRPLVDIQTQVTGNGPLSWKKPPTSDPRVVHSWNDDFLGRLQSLGWSEFVSGASDLPETLTGVVFRFGYFDNFSRVHLEQMASWLTSGQVDIINGLDFYHESKAVMAAIGVRDVRDWVLRQHGQQMLNVLDQCVATTRVLGTNRCRLDELENERPYWLTKFAAWDGNNQSWGSRSLELGSAVSLDQWCRSLRERSGFNHPVVAQHVIRSAQFSRLFVDGDRITRLLTSARIRVTPFLLRLQDGTTVHAGSTATLRAGTFRIHGATDALEVPIRFQSAK